MARKKLSNSQIICIVLLWGILCFILISSGAKLDGQAIFAMVASGIIVFVPIYKQIRRRE
ncbi:MAG TPA: hypothetical protein DCF91_14055 [Porphyromonadaceae bacterium]|nr:hypothetical protein [Porphyromonadaceae bacterium]